jgi:hypothetical protein
MNGRERAVSNDLQRFTMTAAERLACAAKRSGGPPLPEGDGRRNPQRSASINNGCAAHPSRKHGIRARN